MLQKLKKTCIRVYRYLNQRFYPTAVIYHWLYCWKHKDSKITIGRIIGIREYIREYELKLKILLPSDNTYVFDNSFFEEKNDGIKKELFEFPEVFCSEINRVLVFGGASIVLAKKKLLEPIYDTTTKDRWNYYSELLKAYNSSHGLIRYRESGQSINKAICLCGNASGNYFHFLVEILPKLALIEKEKLFMSYPLLVDAIVEETAPLKEALKQVNKSGHEIIYLKDTTSYCIHKMIYISEVSLMPMNTWSHAGVISEDFRMSFKAIGCLKKSIAQDLKKGNYKKIYVARYKTKNARLENDKEIAAMCKREGFHIVFPENMTFVEQAEMFMGARYVMGCMGAALTNMMFCERESTIFVIAPGEHPTKLWSTFGYNMGMNVITVNATITKKAEYVMGDTFRVSKRTISRVLSSLENKTED